MTEPFIAFALLGAIAAVSVGATRVVSWLLDRRDYTAAQQSREAAFVVQAQADLAATGWTPDHESRYQAEIAATTRGDLLAAACFAEQHGAPMFRDRPLPWVLPAVGLFAVIPNRATLVLVVFAFLHYVMRVLPIRIAHHARNRSRVRAIQLAASLSPHHLARLSHRRMHWLRLGNAPWARSRRRHLARPASDVTGSHDASRMPLESSRIHLESGGNMNIRLGVICLLFASAGAASAQQIQSARGAALKPLPAAPKPAHNSMAAGTTPFNCHQYRWPNHPHPGMKPLCEGLEADVLQGESRQAGRPKPSTEVVALPAMGTDAAKRSGMACIGGQAMRRLPNGWEQVMSRTGGWLRCRER